MVELTSTMILEKTKIKNLCDVNKINFWGNRLTNIDIIRKMPNLQVVSLSINEINTLKDFSFCQNLEEIYIRKNKIADINEIVYLQNLKRLRVLWLHDNPCDIVDNYRLIVLKILPNLKKLDNIEVNPKEIEISSKFELKTLKETEYNKLDIQSKRFNTLEIINKDNKSLNLVEEDINNITLRNGEITSDDDSQSSNYGHLHCVKDDNYNSNSKMTFQQEKSNNLLQATICLIKELSIDDLIIISREISQRLDKELLPNNI